MWWRSSYWQQLVARAKYTPIPTNGRKITESELRAFFTCSEFHHLGGADYTKKNIIATIVEQTFVSMALQAMEAGLTNPHKDFGRYLDETLKKHSYKLRQIYLDTEIQSIKRRAAYGLHHVWQTLGLRGISVVSGPMQFTVKVADSAVKLQPSAILSKDGGRRLMPVFFTPEKGVQSIKNDPVGIIACLTFKQKRRFYKYKGGVDAMVFAMSDEPQASFNQVGSHHQIQYRDALQKVSLIENAVKAMENELHWPISPCTRNCPFKSRCMK